MRPTADFGAQQVESNASRALWIALIVTSGVCLSTFFACATPFAALATLAALKLSRRDTIVVVGLVWAANQAIGFGLLGYPWTWDCAAWGLALGASAGLAVVAAKGLSTTGPAPLAVSLPFVASFATFELGLYVAGFVLPGGDGAFSASVIGHVFAVNGLALCGLIAVYHLVSMIGMYARHEALAPSVGSSASFR